MRSAVSVILALVLVLASTGATFADDNGPVKKLGRGLANAVTCPVGLFQGMKDVDDESGPIAAATWGVLTGVVNVVKRAVVGVYETVTFPVPAPAGYKPILTDPEFYFPRTADAFGDKQI